MRKALLPALVPAKRVAERAAAVAPVARQCGCALGAAGLAAWEGGGAGALIRPCLTKYLPKTDWYLMLFFICCGDRNMFHALN